MLMFFYVDFFVLTIFGITAINQLYPVYTMIRKISLLGFFENFEVLITASWILGNFVKISVFLYVSSLGLSQLFQLSDYRIVVLPLSLIILLLSYWNIPNVVYLLDFMSKVQPFYFILVQTLFPLLLYLVGTFRHRRGGKG